MSFPEKDQTDLPVENTASESKDIRDAIVEFNMSYLLFAHRMLKQNREDGKRMLGVSDSMATRILSLTMNEVATLSDSSDVVCQLRLDQTPGRS